MTTGVWVVASVVVGVTISVTGVGKGVGRVTGLGGGVGTVTGLGGGVGTVAGLSVLLMLFGVVFLGLMPKKLYRSSSFSCASMHRELKINKTRYSRQKRIVFD